MRFRDEQYAVILSNEAIEVIKEETKSIGGAETGGILIGTYSKDLSTASITQATGPGTSSKSRRSSFKRGIRSLQSTLDKARRTGSYYLGEWHSHPQAEPIPSRQDVRQMKKIASSHKYNCPEPILIIAGDCNQDIEFLVQIFTKNTVSTLRKSDDD